MAYTESSNLKNKLTIIILNDVARTLAEKKNNSQMGSSCLINLSLMTVARATSRVTVSTYVQ